MGMTGLWYGGVCSGCGDEPVWGAGGRPVLESVRMTSPAREARVPPYRIEWRQAREFQQPPVLDAAVVTRGPRGRPMRFVDWLCGHLERLLADWAALAPDGTDRVREPWMAVAGRAVAEAHGRYERLVREPLRRVEMERATGLFLNFLRTVEEVTDLALGMQPRPAGEAVVVLDRSLAGVVTVRPRDAGESRSFEGTYVRVLQCDLERDGPDPAGRRAAQIFRLTVDGQTALDRELADAIATGNPAVGEAGSGAGDRVEEDPLAGEGRA